MTVTLRKPTSPEYRNFSEEVKKRAGNDSFAYGEDEVINVFIINWLPFKNHPLMLVYSLEPVYKIFDLNGTELSEIKESMEFIKPQVLSLCSNSNEKMDSLLFRIRIFVDLEFQFVRIFQDACYMYMYIAFYVVGFWWVTPLLILLLIGEQFRGCVPRRCDSLRFSLKRNTGKQSLHH